MGERNSQVRVLTPRLVGRCCALLFVLSGTLTAQEPLSAQNAFDYVQQQREAAEKLWKRKDKRGAEILNNLIDYLNQANVRELTSGFFYLRKSVTDVHYDLARSYALSGNKEQALRQLDEVVQEGSLGIDPVALAKEVAFDSLRTEPGYMRFVKQVTVQKKMWGYAGFYTPYKEDLSTDEKIAGLSDLWAEIKFSFVNFD